MSKMVDRRCPSCNRPVRGREDVVHVEKLAADRKVSECPHCKLLLRFVEEGGETADGGRIGPFSYFTGRTWPTSGARA